MAGDDEKAGRSTLTGWLMASIFALSVVAGAVMAVTTLQERAANAETVDVRPPLPVQTAPLAIVDHYLVQESYVGRVEPARETTPAFERAGLVLEVMVDEGDTVAADDVLARLDTAPLAIERDRLLAERASLEADIELARATTDRRAQLIDDGWASGQAHDEARFSVAALSARRNAVEASLAQNNLDLDKSTIHAPFGGTISARSIDEGTVVAAGTAMLRLQETSRPQARIGIPSERADDLAPRQELTLTYQGREITGRVAAITRDLAPGSRTMPILIDLDPNANVTMGQVIRIAMDREIAVSGAWVPLSALQEAEHGLWSIHTVVDGKAGPSVQREAAEILHIAGEHAFVRGTFRDGVPVITAGTHRLSAGQPVTLEKSGGV